MSDAQVNDALHLRAPQPGDVHALVGAEAVCFSDPWPAQFFVSELFAPGRFHRLLVARDGRLAGYLFAAWQYLDLHVLKVATIGPYRRQGHGRRLMALAEDHARAMGGESVTLEVRESNDAAIALYRTLGYAEVGRRRHYYTDGEDALVMTLPLSG